MSSPTPDCRACGRRTRRTGVTVDEAPNTVLYAARGVCQVCYKRAAPEDVGEPMQLCKWRNTRDGWEAELVTGVLVSQTKHFYRLKIDRQVHKYPRPDWEEVIL